MMLNFIILYLSEQVGQLKDQLLSRNEEIKILSAENEAAQKNIEQIENDLTSTESELEQERVSLQKSKNYKLIFFKT